MTQTLAIIWDIKPQIFPDLDIPVLGNLRWYGVLWALSFILAHYLVEKMYKKEGRKKEELDTIFIYTLIGCVAGARLGHCLFYNPKDYLSNPLDILKVWEGGLASHGAGIGLIIACYLLSRKLENSSFASILDKIAITVALAGCLIRTGNLMNSEIVGKPYNGIGSMIFVENINSVITSPNLYGNAIKSIDYEAVEDKVNINGVDRPAYLMTVNFDAEKMLLMEKKEVFEQAELYNKAEDIVNSSDEVTINGNTYSKKVYLTSRHPAQLYEALSCLLIFGLMLWVYYNKYDYKINDGRLIGIFLIGVFMLRFVYEFFKENQEAHEEGWLLNTGQWLSIPMIALGIYFLIKKGNNIFEKQ